ncbi:MAG TPA: hypothetical protein PKB11_13825 [Desulfovibrio sp.]|uniref:hypothetical protein n=1 Tax=Desulfovibrio sp. TaxID=885 RepID=UPI002B7A8D96|nr:hypothetical protein [Desulfovibrio sp.]HMM39834.1 hypothetical protein [Desulfovibrio sp.]
MAAIEQQYISLYAETILITTLCYILESRAPGRTNSDIADVRQFFSSGNYFAVSFMKEKDPEKLLHKLNDKYTLANIKISPAQAIVDFVDNGVVSDNEFSKIFPLPADVKASTFFSNINKLSNFYALEDDEINTIGTALCSNLDSGVAISRKTYLELFLLFERIAPLISIDNPLDFLKKCVDTTYSIYWEACVENDKDLSLVVTGNESQQFKLFMNWLSDKYNEIEQKYYKHKAETMISELHIKPTTLANLFELDEVERGINPRKIIENINANNLFDAIIKLKNEQINNIFNSILSRYRPINWADAYKSELQFIRSIATCASENVTKEPKTVKELVINNFSRRMNQLIGTLATTA